MFACYSACAIDPKNNPTPLRIRANIVVVTSEIGQGAGGLWPNIEWEGEGHWTVFFCLYNVYARGYILWGEQPSEKSLVFGFSISSSPSLLCLVNFSCLNGEMHGIIDASRTFDHVPMHFLYGGLICLMGIKVMDFIEGICWWWWDVICYINEVVFIRYFFLPFIYFVQAHLNINYLRINFPTGLMGKKKNYYYSKSLITIQTTKLVSKFAATRLTYIYPRGINI